MNCEAYLLIYIIHRVDFFLFLPKKSVLVNKNVFLPNANVNSYLIH